MSALIQDSLYGRNKNDCVVFEQGLLYPEAMSRTGMAERIRRRRMELGLNLKQVAERSGINYQNLQQYEQGTTPTAGKLIPLARALGVTAEYLWDGADGKTMSSEEVALLNYFRSLPSERQNAMLIDRGITSSAEETDSSRSASEPNSAA